MNKEQDADDVASTDFHDYDEVMMDIIHATDGLTDKEQIAEVIARHLPPKLKGSK